jgi:hypothetical protein
LTHLGLGQELTVGSRFEIFKRNPTSRKSTCSLAASIRFDLMMLSVHVKGPMLFDDKGKIVRT